ncbi:MAG: YaiO family outer membrane beta-barrel protein [Marinoscillum sp.]
MHHKLPFILILIFASIGAIAQEWKDLGTDELFEKARNEAFDGNRVQAREMLNHILASSPDYADVRILLGRTYAWDGKRDQAKAEFQKVLDKDPDYQDALNAMIDVLMWDDAYKIALSTVNRALETYPNFEDFIYKKASILNKLEQYDEAMNTVNQLLVVNPNNERALQLQETIKTTRQRYTLSFKMGADYFDRDFSKFAVSSSIQLGRRNDWGTSIARINFARRFESTGLQGEIDLYPRIANGVYGYLNYGFSNSFLFPDHRFGAEVFSSLPKSLEASLGLRYMIFGPENDVLIYTGSLGWYHRSMWFSVRPFITPDDRAGTSVSVGFNVRRYFSNPDTYIGLTGGFGYSPDIRTLQSSTGFEPDTEEIFTLRAQRIGITGQKLLKYNLFVTLDIDLAHQELSYDVGNYMWITSVLGNISYRF